MTAVKNAARPFREIRFVRPIAFRLLGCQKKLRPEEGRDRYEKKSRC
jgi:hypothetical protein